MVGIAMGRLGKRTGLAGALAAMLLLGACGGGGAPTLPVPPPKLQAPPPVTAPAKQAQKPAQTPTTDPAEVTGPTAAPLGQGPMAGPQRAIKVGLLVPLTGRASALGQAMLDAAQLALFEAADDRLVLIPRNTDGDVAAAAAEVIAAGAELIIGPLFSADAQAVKAVAATAGVPVVTFSNDWTIAGGGLWAFGFPPQEQVARVTAFAASQGYLSVGLLAPGNAYGQAVADALMEATGRTGGRVAAVERFVSGETDVTSVVKRLSDFDRRHQLLRQERAKLARTAETDEAARRALRRLDTADTFGDMPFQAILIAEGGQSLRELAALFPFFDIDPGPVRFLGTGLWDEAGIGREPALVGGWFAAPSPDARRPFEDRFEASFGAKPQRLATLAYDATALAAVLAKADTDGRPFEAEDLTNPNGFAGVDGIFRLLENGLSERSLAVLEVTRNGFVVVDPARDTFATPSF